MGSRGWVVALGALWFGLPAWAEYHPDMSSLARDLQISVRTPDKITMVLWMPQQFWSAVLSAEGGVSPHEAQQLLAAIAPYTMMAVVEAHVDSSGSFTYADARTLRGTVTIASPQSRPLHALADEDIADGVKALFKFMRPMLANVMGSFGSHLEFLVFPASDAKGARVGEATQEGALLVNVETAGVRYRLPLGSLLPPMRDARTGETFPGNYHFSPFTGNKLERVAESSSTPVSAPAGTGEGAPDSPGPTRSPRVPGSPRTAGNGPAT